MRASVGDHVIVASNVLDKPVRNGTIVEVHRADGEPPYVVEWSDTGKRSVFVPGADTQVLHSDDTPGKPAGAPAERSEGQRLVKSWRISVDVFESGDDTAAHVVLTSDSPIHLDADGRARRAHSDPAVPQVGDEVAVSRALRGLADRLLAAASIDLETATGRPVSLRS